jgi:uncharacterized protein YukE
MSFKVESDNLRRQAKVWRDRKADVKTAKSAISAGFGAGSAFGWAAGSEGVKEMYNEWTSKIAAAMDDAIYSFAYLDSALKSTANDYDETDATVATSSDVLDRQMEEGGYSYD